MMEIRFTCLINTPNQGMRCLSAATTLQIVVSLRKPSCGRMRKGILLTGCVLEVDVYPRGQHAESTRGR